MTRGSLAFSHNGEYQGVAFLDPQLTSGPLFPAFSLLHKSGCELVSGVLLPENMKISQKFSQSLSETEPSQKSEGSQPNPIAEKAFQSKNSWGR